MPVSTAHVAETTSHVAVIVQVASNSQWLFVVVNKRLYTSRIGFATSEEEAHERAMSLMHVSK
jgi:hypothetical protein